MSKDIDRGKPHDITAIDEGLIYLARAYGKARKASRLMAEDGLQPVPPSTLDHWKKVAHPERYNSSGPSGRSAATWTPPSGWTPSSAGLSTSKRTSWRRPRRRWTRSTRETWLTPSRTSLSAQASSKTSPTASGASRPAVVEHRHDVFCWVERQIAKLEAEERGAMEAETVDAEVVEDVPTN